MQCHTPGLSLALTEMVHHGVQAALAPELLAPGSTSVSRRLPAVSDPLHLRLHFLLLVVRLGALLVFHEDSVARDAETSL